jgi:asparagine synthase (glutamine-hydrolysing)
MVADVPLGAFLSGGVDSSAVVGVMAGLSPTPIRTFTIGFEDQQGFDERPFARAAAGRFRTDHTEFVVNSDRAELIERLVWHYDQPFGDSSALPTYLLSELTSGEVTVALSGDGGDELFAGYERFLAAMVAERYRRLPSSVRGVAVRAAGALPPTALRGRAGSIQRLLSQAAAPLPFNFLGWISVVPLYWRERLLPTKADFGHEGYRRLWEESAGAELLDRLLVLNLRTYLLDDLLPKVDRMSMAHALEVRSPFLDTELIEFALRLPAEYRVRGLTLKRIFKDAMSDLLPTELLRRKKRGFGIPLDRWLRTDLAPFVDAMLLTPAARAGAHLDRASLQDLVLAQRHGGHGLGHAVWALLTLEVFLRREGW